MQNNWPEHTHKVTLLCQNLEFLIPISVTELKDIIWLSHRAYNYVLSIGSIFTTNEKSWREFIPYEKLRREFIYAWDN